MDVSRRYRSSAARKGEKSRLAVGEEIHRGNGRVKRLAKRGQQKSILGNTPLLHIECYGRGT